MEAADAASSHHDIIMEYIGKNSRITNNESQQITGLGDTQAANILAVLVKEGELEKKGSGRGAFYQKKNGQ
jgi:predicted HTH transcriptional regulator